MKGTNFGKWTGWEWEKIHVRWLSSITGPFGGWETNRRTRINNGNLYKKSLKTNNLIKQNKAIVMCKRNFSLAVGGKRKIQPKHKQTSSVDGLPKVTAPRVPTVLVAFAAKSRPRLRPRAKTRIFIAPIFLRICQQGHLSFQTSLWVQWLANGKCVYARVAIALICKNR